MTHAACDIVTPAGSPPDVRPHVGADRGRRAILGLGWSAVNTGSAALIAALVFVITSRLLGPEEFGTVALALAILMLVSCAAPGAFGEAIVQRAALSDAHLDTVFWICIAAGAVLYLPILLLAPLVAAHVGLPVLGLLLPFVGLKLLLDLMAVVPQALVVRAMQFRSIAVRTLVGNGLGGLICVVMAVQGYGIWALATAPVITSAVSLVVLVHAARWRPRGGPRRAALRDLWRFGVFSSGNRTLHIINLDQLLLGLLAGPTVLGLYFLGRRLFDLLGGLTFGALTPVAMVYHAATQRDRAANLRALEHSMRASALLCFPVFGGLFILAESAVPLVLGSHWQPAIPAIEAFALIGFMAGLHVPAAALANGLGRPDLWFAFDLSRYLLVIAAIVLLVGQGLPVMMLGLVLANAAVLPGCFVIARRLTGITSWRYLQPLAVPMLATAAMALVLVGLSTVLPGLGAGALLGLQIGLGAIAYVGVALVLSVSQIAELRQTLFRRPAP